MTSAAPPRDEATTGPLTGLQLLRSPPGEPLTPLRRLRRLAALEKADIGVVVVYAVAIGLVSLAVPVASQALVNTVAFTAMAQPVTVLAILVFAGLGAAGLLRTLQYQVVETLQQRFFVRATHDAVYRLGKADVQAFSHHGPSELMNRFFDVAGLQKAASILLLDGLSVFLQGTVSLLLLAFYHPALLAFDVILVALIAFILFGLGRGGVRTAVHESEAKYQTAAWLQEMASAVRTFKSKRADEFAFSRGDALARNYVLARRAHFRVLLRQIIGSYVLQALATAGLLGLGGALVIRGELTLGQLVAAELVVTGVLASVAKFGKYLESFYDISASVHKIGAIVDLGSESEGGAARPVADAPAHLRLDKVSYAYDISTPALTDVSLEVQPGQRLAILGGEASGKSTLVDLLYGLRIPQQGQLLLDGMDTRGLILSELRQDIALASRAEVFDATVQENLHLGREDVNAQLIARVLEMVALSEEVANLPEGTQTRLGPSGSRLTSSQSARLTIARALAQKPRLLIVDQAMDGLGLETARRVLSGISSVAQPPTLLVLTSNRELALEVGPVLRLEKGVIVDAGGLL